MPHLFTPDDYVLLALAAYREEDRRGLWKELHGIDAPADDHRDRLADLARRMNEYLRQTGQVGAAEPLNYGTTEWAKSSGVARANHE
jgi:hypothetical protein